MFYHVYDIILTKKATSLMKISERN